MSLFYERITYSLILRAGKWLKIQEVNEQVIEKVKLHNTQLHNIFSLPGVIRTVKSRSQRWVERVGGNNKCVRILIRKYGWNDQLGDGRPMKILTYKLWRSSLDRSERNLLRTGFNEGKSGDLGFLNIRIPKDLTKGILWVNHLKPSGN